MKKVFVVAFSLFIFFSASLLLYHATPTQDAHMVLDSDEYVLVAQTYAKTGKIMHPEYGMPVHPIGYYWLLGLIYSWFSENQLWVFCAQWLLMLLCFFLLYKCALLLFGMPAAVVAVMLACCNLGFIVFSQIFLAEIMLTACLCAFLYALMLFFQQKKLRFCAAAALLLSCSVVIKPVMLYFAFVTVFFVWFAQQSSWLIKLRSCLLFLLLFYMPLVTYMSYNYHMFGQCAVTTLHAGNLLDYFLPRRILPRLNAQERYDVEGYLAQSSDQHEFQKRSSYVFFDLLKKHPLMYCSAIIEGIVKIFFGLHATQLKIMFNTTLRNGTESFFAMQGTTLCRRMCNYICYGTDNSILQNIALLEALWLLLSYLLVLCAVLLLCKRRAYVLLLFLGTYVGYIVFVASFEGCGRYRMMLEPVLILLTAYALVECYYILKNFFVRRQSVYANV